MTESNTLVIPSDIKRIVFKFKYDVSQLTLHIKGRPISVNKDRGCITLDKVFPELKRAGFVLFRNDPEFRSRRDGDVGNEFMKHRFVFTRDRVPEHNQSKMLFTLLCRDKAWRLAPPHDEGARREEDITIICNWFVSNTPGKFQPLLLQL